MNNKIPLLVGLSALCLFSCDKSIKMYITNSKLIDFTFSGQECSSYGLDNLNIKKDTVYKFIFDFSKLPIKHGILKEDPSITVFGGLYCRFKAHNISVLYNKTSFTIKSEEEYIEGVDQAVYGYTDNGTYIQINDENFQTTLNTKDTVTITATASEDSKSTIAAAMYYD